MKEFTFVEYKRGGNVRMALDGVRRVQLLFDTQKQQITFSENGTPLKTLSGSHVTRVMFKRMQTRMTYMETFAPGDTYIVELAFQDGSHERYVWDPLWSRDVSGKQTEGIETLQQSFIDVGAPAHMVVINKRQWMQVLFWLAIAGVAWFTFFY